jgi:hypothetical protein
MVQIASSVEKIRVACEQVGISEFARLSGVNYTTIRALAESGFRPKTVKILEKLEAAAERQASAA